MSDFDAKGIGLAAKDILLGIGAVAAGSVGGPAAAEGVSKAGGGLDRILSMAGVLETRGDKFDRADFAARPQPVQPPQALAAPQAALAAPQADPLAPPVAATATQKPAVNEPSPASPPASGPLTGDARIAAAYLHSLGWQRRKVQQILSGPEQASLASIVARETKGFRARGAEGVRVAQAEGSAVPVREGHAVPAADGQTVPAVSGSRVREG